MRLILVILASVLALGQNAKPPERVDWMRLRGLNYRTGKITADAKALDGAFITMLGYMVPFDDDQNRVTEFLLVPIMGACVHAPPPPPNQIVIVRMDGRKKAEVSWDRPVWVQGKMKIETVKSPYGNLTYSMSADKVAVSRDY